MHAEEDLLPLSAIADYVYCHRRAALHRIEQVWEENRATAEGHHLHDRVHEQGAESRGDVRIARGLPLRSLRLGLSGIADVVEFRRAAEGEPGVPIPCARGRWMPFPVEYKRGVQRHESSFEVQLCAQALCLEEMLHATVPAGALFYGLSRRRQDVTFDAALRTATEAAARGLHELVAAGKTPPPEHGPKCKLCSLLTLCMPETVHRSARRYVTEAGAVEMTDETRKTVLVAYQKRKQEEMMHPFIGESAPLGLFFLLQAQLLSRHLRGDLDGYPPVFWK